MEKKSYLISASPSVVIRSAGDLTIKGAGEDAVIISAQSAEDLNVTQDGDHFEVECHSNCVLRVPPAASITVTSVGGNMMAKGLEGALAIQAVSGNLNLKNVCQAEVGEVSGNLYVKRFEGNLTVNNIDGNASIRDIEGAFTVTGAISGNLHLEEVGGDTSAQVSGTIWLHLDPVNGFTYQFEAGGDIHCRLARDASAVLNIEQAGNVEIKMKNVDLPRPVELPLNLTFGDGDATLDLSAGGNVIVTGLTGSWEWAEGFGSDLSEDFEGLAEEITEQVTSQFESQIEMFERQMEEQMENLSASLASAGMSEEFAERMSERAREASARATARAQERMQRAREKIQRKMEAAQRRAEQRAKDAERRAREAERRSRGREKGTWGIGRAGMEGMESHPMSWMKRSQNVENGPPEVSEEERMAILKMLQEKKITAEQAEQLLRALEGGED